MQWRLTDERWQLIEQMLLGKAGDRGRSGTDNRQFVDAVLWIAHTGKFWCDLPKEYGNSNTVYQRFGRWSRAGVWNRVFATLGREACFHEAFGESDIVRRHQEARATDNNLNNWAFKQLAAEVNHPSSNNLQAGKAPPTAGREQTTSALVGDWRI
ncbi:hypothetical protein BH10PSE18_BH10PSE18_02090 [soil metagenome]